MRSDFAGDNDEDLWVFGYGSLMWKPGFPFAERAAAELIGFHRDFCIYSTHHRGSHDKPGLVLGLDRGGICHGAAFRVPAGDRARTLGYLRAREQVSGVYREARVHMRLDGTRDIYGVAYIVERAHPSYAMGLTIAEQGRLIRAACGSSGPNVEYLVNTCRLLREAGIRDARMERLLTAVGGYFATRGFDGPTFASCRTLLGATRQHPPHAPRMRRDQRRRFMHRIKLDALND